MRDARPKRHYYDSIPAQTLIALSFNTISLFAGVLVSVFTPQFRAAPWILALFPPILTIRGGIGGIFSGNLATMLHLGLIRPQMRDNTPIYYQLMSSIFVITLIDASLMGLFAFALNLILGEASIGQILIFTVIPSVACVMAMALSIPITLTIAVATFRKGLDPDILVYPILASVNDILVTCAFVATVFMVLTGGFYLYLLGGLFLSILMVTGLLAWRHRRVDFFHKTIREGTTMVIMSSLFGSVNGLFLSGMSAGLQRFPGAVVLYPAMTNALGNIGSIIGSTTTTNLALGAVKNFREEVRGALKSIAQVESMALLIHVVFGVATFLVVRATTPIVSLSSLLAVALFSNVSSFLPISLFALFLALQAFKRGLNPDNIVIPVITTVSDTTATIALIQALAILRFTGVI